MPTRCLRAGRVPRTWHHLAACGQGPPFTDWVALGTLKPLTYSGFFRTGWPSTPDIAASPVLRLGVSLEAADVVQNITEPGLDRVGIANLLAQDLATYLGSYSAVTPVGERLLVPPSAIGAWLTRIKEKTARDPNFLYK
jgi:Protein of unknown function (DUF775)